MIILRKISKQPTTQLKPGQFSFPVGVNSKSSATAWINDKMVATLFGGKEKTAGKNVEWWNGKDDFGNNVPNGNYTIKGANSNIEGTQIGIVGNTSTALSGPTVHRGFERIFGIAIAGDYLYYCNGYNEGRNSQFKALLSDPQVCLHAFTDSTGTNADQESNGVCTDGVRLYWDGVDPFSTSDAVSFVFGTLVSDDSEVLFSAGVPVDCVEGRTYPKAIGVITNVNGRITGRAVQTGSSGFLFLARKGMNNLYVHDKLTGALAQTISISNVNKVAVDSSNNLWVSSGTDLIKYSVNSSTGELTELFTVEDVVVSVQGMGCNGTTLWIMDGGTSQQIKRFNSSGASVSTFGTAGGYATNAAYSNSKFYFDDPANRAHTSAIAFEGDGTYWVVEAGNSSVKKYNSSDVYQTKVQYLPKVWSHTSIGNRSFADYLEFDVTNSPFSWEQVANWGYPVPANRDDNFKRLYSLQVVPNGKTMAFQKKASGDGWEFVELVEGGKLEFTGVTVSSSHAQIYPDGSVRRQNVSVEITNAPQNVYKRVYNYDGAIPVAGAETIIETSPPKTAIDPLDSGTRIEPYAAGEQTSDGAVIVSSPNSDAYGSKEGYHLGKIKNGQYVWRAAKGTFAGYKGQFPDDGRFDIGNSVGNAGGRMRVLEGDLIGFPYHGEFWKSQDGPGQTNMIAIYNTDGIFLGVFGTTTWDSRHLGEAAPGMAGNAFFVNGEKEGDNYYFKTNDESFHGGIGVWEVTGVGDVQYWTSTVTITQPVSKPLTDYIDLLEGQPHRGAVIVTGGRITRADGQAGSNENSDMWDVRTGVKTYDIRENPDLYARFGANTARTRDILISLDANTDLSAWSLSADVNFDRHYPNQDANNGFWLQVLDNVDKVIAELRVGIVLSGSYPITVYGNNTLIVTGTETEMRYIIERWRDLSISCAVGSVTFTYNGNTIVTGLLDGTSDWTKPTKLRLRFKWTASSLQLKRTFGIKDAKFYKTQGTPVTPSSYLHLSSDEVAIVRQRLKSGPYKTKGDAGKTNSFGDGDKVYEYANKLTNNPLFDYYTGPTKNEDGSTISSSNPVKAWAKPEPNRNSLRIGTSLLCAAFLGAVLEDGTAKTNYINAAKTCILNQIDIVKYPNLDFSNTGMWRTNEIGDINPGFEIAEWLGSFANAYNYQKSNFTTEQRALIELWILNAALYFNGLLSAQNNQYFVDRANGNYTFTTHPGNENDIIDTTHDGGYTIRRFTLHFNNRLLSIATFLVNAGVLFDNEDLIEVGTRYTKELITYAMYPNGMTSDMERATSSDKERGLSYFGGEVANFANQISVLGRSGRFDLIDFSTTAGAYGTESPSKPKNIKLAMDALTSMYCKDKNWKKDGEILDGNYAPTSWYSVLDALMAVGNMYYRDEKIRKVFHRDQSGCNPYPASPAGNGPVWSTFGNGNYFPGVALLYFHTDYNTAPKPFVR